MSMTMGVSVVGGARYYSHMRECHLVTINDDNETPRQCIARTAATATARDSMLSTDNESPFNVMVVNGLATSPNMSVSWQEGVPVSKMATALKRERGKEAHMSVTFFFDEDMNPVTPEVYYEEDADEEDERKRIEEIITKQYKGVPRTRPDIVYNPEIHCRVAHVTLRADVDNRRGTDGSYGIFNNVGGLYLPVGRSITVVSLFEAFGIVGTTYGLCIATEGDMVSTHRIGDFAPPRCTQYILVPTGTFGCDVRGSGSHS